MIEKIFMTWLGYTRQKVTENVDFIKLQLGVLLLTHIMACMWIKIGQEKDGWVGKFITDHTEVVNDLIGPF